MDWKEKYRKYNKWTTDILGIKVWGIPYLALCWLLGIPPDLEAIREYNPPEGRRRK